MLSTAEVYSIERGGERDSSLERSASFRGRVSKGRTVRMAAMFCRNMRGLFYLVSEGSNGLAARSIVHNNFSNVGRKDDFLNGLDLVELSDMSRVGFVRLMRNSSFVDEHAKKKTEDTEEHPEDAIERASHELFKQSNVIEHHEESPTEEPSAYTVKDHIAENPGADVANEVWSAKEQDGTSVFTDHSDKESAEL